MALAKVGAEHARVICDACGAASAELCTKRAGFDRGRAWATAVFQRHGWYLDPARRVSVRAEREADREGVGRWYCPACSKRTHL